MAKKNKIANLIADLNYEYLSLIAMLCGEPVDTLIHRIVERAASKKKTVPEEEEEKRGRGRRAAQPRKKSSAVRPIRPARAA